MAAKEIRNTTETDSEIASVVSQIISDILDYSAGQSEPPPYNQTPYEPRSADSPQPTCSNVQQEGDGERVTPTPTRNRNAEECNGIEEDSGNTKLYQTCTVKEMLDEILDCTVIRRPSLELPSTSAMSDRNIPVSVSPPPEYLLDPRLIPNQIYSIRSDSTDGTGSRVQCTVKEVLSELMDYTVFKKLERQVNHYDYNKPSTSRTRSEHLERSENTRGYQIYRGLSPGIVNSTNAIHDEMYLHRYSALSIQRILPSYASVLKMGPPPKMQAVCSSCSFVPRKPPPSYAEVEGIWEDSPSLISSESAVFGPDPTYMICPRCRTAVITEVQVRRSYVTHLLAVVLCLCLCWPCCLMPYCLRSCNYSHHTCPHCSYYFGLYRPF